jgi:hypothetical protein
MSATGCSKEGEDTKTPDPAYTFSREFPGNQKREFESETGNRDSLIGVCLWNHLVHSRPII